MEVASANKTMGDLNKALALMCCEEGCDKDLLTDRQGNAVPKTDLLYTPNDQKILRQYECGAEPSLLLSKFFQINGPTSHEVLFHIRARIAQMREDSFAMFEDISHSDLPNLTKRNKTVFVVSSQHDASDEETGRAEQPMDPCIELFRDLFATDLEQRCGLANTDGPVTRLPMDIAVACLLNPLYGGQKRIVASGLMTAAQYGLAESNLISRMQTMRESECDNIVNIDTSSSDDDNGDGLDDDNVRSLSSAGEKAKEEYRIFCNFAKKKKYFPTAYSGATLRLGHIEIGKVETKGDNINASAPFVGCNLADFVDNGGHFDLVRFFKLQQVSFPILFKLAVCLASIRTNEVGCERFFSTAGYVSSPRRTNLKVRNYECIASLRRNMQQVYIDERWVMEKYLVFEKSKGWNNLEATDDMRVLDLEREILADELGIDIGDMPSIVDTTLEESQLTT
jgi:hypothetical protein